MKLRLLSLMLVFLILSMPISFAYSFTAYSEGQDGKRNLARPNDQITLIAEVQGADVGTQDILYVPLGGNPRSFNECNHGVCRYKLDKRAYAGVERFTVRYNSRAGVDDRVVNTIIDHIGPTLGSVTINKGLVGPKETIVFNILVSDSACHDMLCNNRCSGISHVNIYRDVFSTKILEIPIKTEIDDCSREIAKNYLVSELKLKEGQNTLLFRAVDNFGNVGDFQTLSLILDSTPPSLKDNKFYLTKDEKGIQYYNNPLNDVEFFFYLDDSDVHRVKASLTALNPSLGDVTFDCEDIFCSKKVNLNLVLSQTSGIHKITVPIELSDELGNNKVYNLNYDVEIDRVGPLVKKVESSSTYKDGNKIGISSNSYLKVNLEEKGVGLNNADIYIDYSPISNEGVVKAESCEPSWDCNFPLVNINVGGTNTLKVLRTSKDDLGNQMVEDYSFEVYSDITPPFIEDIFVTFPKTSLDFPTKGDVLNVVALIKDDSKVIGRGNFSSVNSQGIFEVNCGVGGSSSSDRGTIDGDRGTVGSSSDLGTTQGTDRGTIGTTSSTTTTGSFERGSPEFGTFVTRSATTTASTSGADYSGFIVCEWNVPVTISGTVINGEIDLEFIDEFKNNVSGLVSVPLIYGLFDEPNPNYWSAQNMVCSPSLLDREMGELIEQEMYCNFRLVPLTNNPQRITSMDLVSCDSPHLSDFRLDNEGTNPYITLVFDKGDYQINELKVECNLDLMSVVGTNIVTNKEVENVTIDINFFNNPFGYPDQNLIDEIEDIRETWAEGFGKIIYWLSLLERIATEICGAINTVQEVVEVLTISSAMIPDMTGGTVARASTETTVQASEGMFAALDPYCKFVNCQYSSEDEGVLGYLGGGGGLASFTEEIQFYAGGQLVDSLGGDYKDYMNVKNNIYLSALTLCVPGIIHGLAKYRQIQCFYGYCLQDMSVMGVPYDVCQELKAYQECKYFVTPIFTFFPIVNLFDEVMNLIKGAISDPFVALGLVMNWMCTDYTQTGWGVCRISRVINVATKAYNNVMSILNLIDEFDNDYCDMLEESSRSAPGGSSRSSSGRGFVG